MSDFGTFMNKPVDWDYKDVDFSGEGPVSEAIKWNRRVIEGQSSNILKNYERGSLFTDLDVQALMGAVDNIRQVIEDSGYYDYVRHVKGQQDDQES